MLPVIERTSAEPIRRQIFNQLRAQILNGTLREGEALVSTRQLAQELAVSRSTVVEAYDMLLSEGFLESRQGAQTVVAAGVAMQMPHEPIALPNPKPQQVIRADFSTGRPDLSSFPRALWQRTLSQSMQTLSAADYGYTGPEGYAPLRAEIAAWLARSRGIAVRAEDVFVTAGATHALHILAELLCAGGSSVILEDPCHKGLYDTIKAANCGVIPIPADDHGMQTDLLKPDARARMIYVTPSHQFPLGGILPAARRTALIRFAREQNIYIVEDDYDSEFRYVGAPISPLYSLDSQRVVYVGTFSKSMFPALRIGFALLPKDLQSRWRYLRTHNDVQNPVFEQAALAAFLQLRALDRHIRTMRKRYAARRQTLISALQANFGEACTICGDVSGLHLAAQWHGLCFRDDFQAFCKRRGIVVRTIESHCIEKGKHQDQLVLGYGHLEPDAIESGVKFLADAMGAYRMENRTPTRETNGID